jgi:hypothetical protein
MKRYLCMRIMRGMLLAVALGAVACGGKQSVASKSAAAYEEAQVKGTPVGGGHEHGGHGPTETSAGAAHLAHATTTAPGEAAMDHSAHGASADGHAGMDHGASAGTGVDQSAHGAVAGGGDHAAMGHSAGSANVHASHATAGDSTSTDHAAPVHRGDQSTHAQHGATSAHAMHRATTGSNAHAQHRATNPSSSAHAGHTAAAATTPRTQNGTQPANTPTGHDQHGAIQTSPATGGSAHAQHGVSTTRPRELAPAPRTSSEMQRMQPAATLRRDAFDAAAPIAVAEAARATQGGDHAGHDTRGITPGEDHENPPTPRPATRDGRASAQLSATHGQHGAAANATGQAEVATVYACPMHPEVTSDKPGLCPKCGMALVESEGNK